MTDTTIKQTKERNEPKMAYTLSEAARVVGVSLPTMGEWVHIPGFPAFKTGTRWVIPAASLARWLDERAQAGGNVAG